MVGISFAFFLWIGLCLYTAYLPASAVTKIGPESKGVFMRFLAKDFLVLKPNSNIPEKELENLFIDKHDYETGKLSITLILPDHIEDDDISYARFLRSTKTQDKVARELSDNGFIKVKKVFLEPKRSTTRGGGLLLVHCWPEQIAAKNGSSSRGNNSSGSTEKDVPKSSRQDAPPKAPESINFKRTPEIKQCKIDKYYYEILGLDLHLVRTSIESINVEYAYLIEYLDANIGTGNSNLRTYKEKIRNRVTAAYQAWHLHFQRSGICEDSLAPRKADLWPFETLGIDTTKGTTRNVVRPQFLMLVKEYHPDKGITVKYDCIKNHNKFIFMEIDTAWKILDEIWNPKPKFTEDSQ